MVLLEIFLIFLATHHFSPVYSLNKEGIALLSFKNSLTSYPQGSLQNWNSSDETPCSWNGITCREERVVSISLPDEKLSGILHPAFGNLVRLQALDLSQNFFNGSIPASVLQCKRLETFLLSQNNLTGSIPNGFGSHLTSLQNLNLSFNGIGGSIPSDFGNLSNLRGTLDLSHNFLTGTIPRSLGSLPESLYIDLSYNNLSGAIPLEEVLLNIGPTAYTGNPFLCGLPLDKSCPVSRNSNSESFFHCSSHGNGGKSCYIFTLAASIVLGFCLICLLIFCYKRANSSKVSEAMGGCNFREALMVKTELFCFAKYDVEPLPEIIEKYSFVLLDQHVGFDLDQLLKASAYLLGKNGNGIVYKVVLENGKSFAVRRLEDGAYQRFKEFQIEVEAIGKVGHPNIVSLLAYCWSVDEKLLIYEYIPHGDLSIAIHGRAEVICFTPLSWPERMKIMRGVAKGLAFLHEFSPRKYVHGDLKPSNILLGPNMEPHISDFGLSRLANTTAEFSASKTEQTAAGTPQQNSPFRSNSMCSSLSVGGCQYQAPEALRTVKPSQKWDVYSFGLILLEIISGKLPVIQMGSSEVELVQWIHLGISDGKSLSCVVDPLLAEEVVKEEAEAAVRIGLACTNKSPDKRPCMRFVSECLEKLAFYSN